VYGPGQTSGVVAKFIRAALDGKALEITGDGTQTRDFVYVKDVVKATALAAEQGLSGVMEVGTGEAISINSLAETVLRLTNSHSKVVHTEAQAGEAHDSVASDSCLSLHNWFSVYSLEDGLAETIEAMK